MFLIMLLSFTGTFLITRKTARLRLIGFSICLVGSLIWILYGHYIHDKNVMLQFTAYTIINCIGIYSNRKGDEDAKATDTKPK